MTSNTTTAGIKDVKVFISTLWVVMMLNYLYCDVMTLMDPQQMKQIMTGTVGSLHITQTFLLGSAILMEIPIAMLLLSRILQYRANRLTNIIAGSFMALVQGASMFVGTAPTLYYIFFSVLEVACLVFIVIKAGRWKNPELAIESNSSR